MITPVLLCGGAGSRLWPLSRKSFPKQFVDLVGEKTLFQTSAQRMVGQNYARPLVLTNADFRFVVEDQLAKINITPSKIIIEPEGRNTAPAILAAALWLQQEDPNGLMLVSPSDHLVPNNEAFQAAVKAGMKVAEQGKIVTFGVKPTYAETGYGYLELEKHPEHGKHIPIQLTKFIEKPHKEEAESMIASENYLWNAGIFLFSVKTIVEAFEAYSPQLLEPVRSAISRSALDLGFTRLDPEAWSEVEDISIDYAVMERADNLSVIPFFMDWSDLGGWDAVWRQSIKDSNGVATSGPVTHIDCANSLLRSEEDAIEVVGIGLDNIVVIATLDAVLVVDVSNSQDVKKAVDVLKQKKVKQATHHPRDYRPWGWFESLILGDRFQVKRIVVQPGEALSLQSHHHRAEHWIVVEGTARVTIDETVKLVTENQSVYIPLGAIHRMENPGKVPMVLIEVQTGRYLGEDDIVRYEDVYSRA